MNSIGCIGALTAAALLAGCSGGSYLKAPVSPGNASSSMLYDGSWGGVAEPLYRQRTLNSARAIGKAINCQPYRDNVSFQVSQGRIEAQIGSAPTYELTALLDDRGYFYQRIMTPSQRSGYRYKGTEIWITGQFDAAENRVEGQIGYGPAGLGRGCLGSFVARRNGDANTLASATEPFSTEYHFVTVVERE